MQAFNASVPNVARMYDFYLGGKDNFTADRQAAERMISQVPAIPAAAVANRQFLRHAVTAAAKAGIRQFVDIGCGLPAADNTHEVAHRVDPGIRVAYVDRDPQVVTHAKVILRKGNEETVRVLDRDLREPSAVTCSLGDFIDFSEPAGIMLGAVMHFVPAPECYETADDYKNQIAPGSFLILSHSTADLLYPDEARVIEEEYRGSSADIFLRSRDQVSRFFDGMRLLDPGITDVADWRTGPHEAQRTLMWGGVGTKTAR